MTHETHTAPAPEGAGAAADTFPGRGRAADTSAPHCQWPAPSACRQPVAFACSAAWAHHGWHAQNLCATHAATWLGTFRVGDVFSAERVA
jgi:hypothetical protein